MNGKIGFDEIDSSLLDLLNKLNNPPDVLKGYYTKEQIDKLIAEINNYLDIVLTVDKTYTKDIIDWKLGLLNDKLNSMAVIDTYTKTQIDAKIAAVRKLLSAKMDKSDIYTKEEVQRMIESAIASAKPDLTQYYNKTETDAKITGFLNKSSIVDSLTVNDTGRPISSNQMAILANKIDSLKQSASDGSTKVAAAITGIGLPIGSIPQDTSPWGAYKDALMTFKKEVSPSTFLNQIPDQFTLEKSFTSTDFTYGNIASIGFDFKYSNHIFVYTHGQYIYEYDRDYNLIASAKLATQYSNARNGIMYFSPNCIGVGRVIISKHDLSTVYSNTTYDIIGVANNDAFIVYYFNSTQSKLTIGCVENGTLKLLIENLQTSSSPEYIVVEKGGVPYLYIQGYDRVSRAVWYNVYIINSDNSLTLHNNRLPSWSSYNRMRTIYNDIIFGTAFYTSLSSYETYNYYDINGAKLPTMSSLNNTTSTGVFDGISDAIYVLYVDGTANTNSIICNHKGSAIWQFDLTIPYASSNKQIQFDTVGNCIYYTEFSGKNLSIYKLTFKSL